jgi:dipeptidyl aminopeptidase/acylaminoacyl peptidase
MMSSKTIRQYGLWDSPIQPASLAHGINFSDVAWSEDGSLVWREQRSDRGILVVLPAGSQAFRDLNHEYSCRARVGYGGGDFSVGGGNIYFVESESGRIYCQPLPHGIAQPLTPQFGYYASPALSPDSRWLLFVHTNEGNDSLGIVDALGSNWPGKLISGNDFYMQPCWHPNSRSVAWIAWDFPNMPWDGTWLRVGQLRFDEDRLPVLEEAITVAGGENVSIFQPEFSRDGQWLAYVSDQTGWWQIYLYHLISGEYHQVTGLEAEHGAPAWVQGVRNYAFSPDSSCLYFLRNREGFVSLWRVGLESANAGSFHEEQILMEEEYTWLGQPAVSPDGKRIALLASGGRIPLRLIALNLENGNSSKPETLRRSTSEELPAGAYSETRPITWKGMDGNPVYGLYSPPHNDEFEGTGEPPLIVHIHGGPTSQRMASFNSQAQFFTSRGYAYLEVNYRGSTGYGRLYRDMLRENWGIYDVQDAVSGARSLVEDGQVDGAKLVIIGGSAGGFTVLKALEDYPGFFKAGICLYGVSNQFTLAAETHKFEARYTDSLIGPLPEASSIYRQRSPIFFVDQIKDPIAIFQGEIDRVVPRNQSDTVVESLRRRGVPHEYVLYPGEGHGFRKIETIEHFYAAVDKFLRQYVIYA